MTLATSLSLAYFVATMFRVLACIRLGLWLCRMEATGAVFALGVFFYVIAGQRSLWLIRSGFELVTPDVLLMVGVMIESLTLLVLWYRFWRREI